MRRVSGTAAIAVILGLSLGSAQARETVVQIPVVRDLPRSFSIPDGVVTDILGLDVGMRVDEARAVLARLAPGCCSAMNYQIDQNQGVVRVIARYQGRFYVTFNDGGMGNNITVGLTTPLIGGRVFSVTRRVSLSSHNVPLDQMEAAIVKKYGASSLSYRHEDHTHHIWLYGSDGAMDLRHIKSEWLANRYSRTEPREYYRVMDCIRALDSDPAYWSSSYFRASQIVAADPYDGCSLGLKVSLKHSVIAGRTDAADYRLLDFRRRHEEQRAVKAFLDDELRKVLAAEQPVLPRQ